MRRKETQQNLRAARRSFLKSTGALAAGLSVASVSSAGRAEETLALKGGPKSVTDPDSKHREAYRWPLYGEDEKDVGSYIEPYFTLLEEKDGVLTGEIDFMPDRGFRDIYRNFIIK